MARQPFIMEVRFYQSDEVTPVAYGTETTWTNESNGETATEVVGDGGYCIFDCQNFESGWNDGDVISYTIAGNNTRGKFIKIKAIATDTSQLKYLKCKVEEEA